MWQALSQRQLTLDQTSTPLQIDRYEVEEFYYPLALELIARGRNHERLIIAIAGPPGSGKTAFTTLLTAVINAELQSEQAVMLQQDGWHYPNAYLDSHFVGQKNSSLRIHCGDDPAMDTQASKPAYEVPLRLFKGSPETYDTQAAYTCLQRIRQGETTHYPVYSRKLHDPIPEGGMVLPNHHFVLVEGNYWLLMEKEWLPFQTLFDVTIFLTADPASLVEGLSQRHLRGGKSAEFVHKHMQMVDIPNIERVLKHSSPAQFIVEKKNNYQIARIVR